MMIKHKEPTTVTRHGHVRKNLEQNAVSFINYEEA